MKWIRNLFGCHCEHLKKILERQLESGQKSDKRWYDLSFELHNLCFELRIQNENLKEQLKIRNKNEMDQC